MRHQFTAEDVPHDRLGMVLGVDGDGPTATEDEMATTKKKTTKTKAAAKKAARPKAAKAPKEDLVVFAFRLPEAERDAIHKTAGPRNATQFVRRVARAFARKASSRQERQTVALTEY